MDGWVGGWVKAPQAKQFNQQLNFLLFFYTSFDKITSEIKCCIKWELQKNVEIKFKAVCNYNILIKSSKQKFLHDLVLS